MVKATKHQLKNKTKGVIYLLISAFAFACMSLFVNLAGDLPVFQKAFFRNIVAVVISFVIIIRSNEKFTIQKGSMQLLLMRASFGTLGILANFYAISNINIADALILNKLSPFCAVIASIFILKEIADKHQWGAIALAFVGALLVVKPSFGFFEFAGVSETHNLGASLIGLGGGIAAGIAYTFMRKLSLKGERSTIIVAFFSFFSCIVMIPFMIFTYEPMSTFQLFCLFGAGLFACLGQLTITSAYAACPAREISVYDYTTVIFAAVLGMCFLDQYPDIWSVCGYIIIIASSVYSYIHNHKEKPLKTLATR